MKRNDDSQRGDRLAPQDRRPRRRPEGPRSGWPIQPVRSDLVGEADKLLAATQPARPILAYPPLYPLGLTAPRAASPAAPGERPAPRGAGSVHCIPDPDTPSHNQPPALPVNHIHYNPAGIPGAQEVHMVLKEPHVRAA